MPATAFVLLIATVLSVEGDVARIDRGRAARLRPGDAGVFYYQLTVGSEIRRIDVGAGTLIDVGERHALIAIAGGAEVRPQHRVELRIEVPGDEAEALLRRARPRGPAPAPANESQEETGDVEASVRDFVLAWARAWSDQRIDAYLACYARNFRPPAGMSRGQWKALRRQRIASPSSIAVEVEDLKIVTVASRVAIATFLQSYRSDTFEDRVPKLLDLVREDGEWKILEERVD